MTVLSRRSCWFMSSVVLAMFVSSCTNAKKLPRSGEESVASTSSDVPSASVTAAPVGNAAPSCGHEVQTHGQGYDEAKRACLWDAYRAGRPAELALTRHTIEGDPITITLRIRSASLIEVLEDNQDRFGARGVRSSTCTEIERGSSVNERSGFMVRGCRGNVQSFDVP